MLRQLLQNLPHKNNIKSEGEIDIAYVRDQQFWPLAIKWRHKIRPKDVKQITKYKKHARISSNAWTGLRDTALAVLCNKQ